jgi:hypothetical protein
MFLSNRTNDRTTEMAGIAVNEHPAQEGTRTGSLIGLAEADIQKELDIMMNILEENMDKLSEGEYLRGMNALGALHKHKRDALRHRRPGELLRCWLTLEEIEETDEDLYDEIMGAADDIVVELCGDEASIYTNDDSNLVHRGAERDVFQQLLNYKPVEGNAGYETSPMVLHHAIQIIMARVFDDTHFELETVRPVSCPCGWRGPHGNWDRHIANVRHQRWTNAMVFRNSAIDLADARRRVVARREQGIVYIVELHSTPETRIATEEAVATAEAAGERVVFINAVGEMSWFDA